MNTYPLTKHQVIKTYWGVEVYLHAFLTSAQYGGELSASLARVKDPGTD